jgi:hypothetical protein
MTSNEPTLTPIRRRLAAIVIADVASHTWLMERAETGTRAQPWRDG